MLQELLLTYHKDTVSETSTLHVHRQAITYLDMSASASTSLPAGHGLPPQDPCRTCHKDIERPCAIKVEMDCPECAHAVVRCDACDGSGLHPVVLFDGSQGDCNACAASGIMTSCIECRGRSPERERCFRCGGRDCYLCERCLGSRRVNFFNRFCRGEGQGMGTRRHPNARNFPQCDWSEQDIMDTERSLA